MRTSSFDSSEPVTTLSSPPQIGARIDATGVARHFPETGPVLTPLDFCIESGEFVSFLGPSGCGKSTLLRLIAGLDQADQGRLTLESFGRSFFRGFVFQEAHLLPWRTAIENAALPLELMGCPKGEREAEARAILNKFGLKEAVAKLPHQLSGGMKMRVSLARALVARPSLLLLDEPFAALDEQTRFSLQEDLRRIWSELKMTVLFVTHSISEAAFLSDRALVFSPRPARIRLDRRLDLPAARPPHLRSDARLLAEIENLGRAFRAGGET